MDRGTEPVVGPLSNRVHPSPLGWGVTRFACPTTMLQPFDSRAAALLPTGAARGNLGLLLRLNHWAPRTAA